jgi:hypothetical protein
MCDQVKIIQLAKVLAKQAERPTKEHVKGEMLLFHLMPL